VGRRFRGFSLAVTAWLMLGAAAWAQAVPAPSQVAPPVIAPPTGGGHISIPQVPAGAAIPAQAKKLSFKLLGFDIDGEFEELAPARHEIEAPLIGRRIVAGLLRQIPYSTEQGIISAEQRILAREQGILSSRSK
jgi:hypothetical protein